LDWLNAGNPLVAIAEIAEAVATRVTVSGPSALDIVLPALLRRYAAFHLVLAAVCLFWATARLRKIALRRAFGKARKATVGHRSRPPVGDVPMLWKELWVEGGMRINVMAALILAILFLFSMSFGVWGAAYHYMTDFVDNRMFHEEMNAWVRI